MPESRSDEIRLVVHPSEGGADVPVSLLAQELSGLQELVYLFAFSEEGKTVRHRFRVPAEILEGYQLRCRPPSEGSFAISSRVVANRPELFAQEKIERVVGRFHNFSKAIYENDVPRIQDLVPNDRLRDRILVSFGTLSPPPGSGYRFSLMNGAGSLVTFDESLASRIQNLLNGSEERAEVQTVTGELQALDFSEGKLTIFYLPKSRELECFYDETVEPMLLEKRRDLIQVTGRVAMDAEGYPKKITDVDRITDVDLTPFVLNEVIRGQIRIRFREPLTLDPKLTESQQLMFLEDETFGIEVFAPSRSELLEELKEQVIMLWTEYATEDDDNLSDRAKALKNRLLNFCEAASNA